QRISFFYVPVNLKGQQLFCDPDPVDQILVKIDMDYSFPYLVSAESASSARYCFLNPFTLACGSSTIKYWLLYLTHTSSIRSVKRIDPPPTNTVRNLFRSGNRHTYNRNSVCRWRVYSFNRSDRR